jgi:hypothetical protein
MHDIHWYGFDSKQSLLDLVYEATHNKRTEYVWLLHESVDYTDFDLRFVPDRYQQQMLHAWPAHNNKHALTTWLIPVAALLAKGYTGLEKVFHDEQLLPSAPVPIEGPGWHWQLNPRIDYSDFDLEWFPDIWDWEMNHAFALKGKQHLAYTYLMSPLANKTKYHASDLELTDHLEFVTLEMIGEGDVIGRKQRYFGNMEDALRTAIRKSTREWLWVLSDCCDYHGFDFSWLPDLDQRDHVHCWPSGTCEKGETFLINTLHYKDGRDFRFNFDHEPVHRKPWPVVTYTEDNLAKAINNNRSNHLNSLYLQYSKTDTDTLQPIPCLWKDRPVIGMNRSHSSSLVPRDCTVKNEIYDYPHLIAGKHADAENCDIIFISYDEKNADNNWKVLADKHTRAKRLHGVKGMERALEAAAEMSSHDWFYAVFAKTKIHESFDFSFVPDYWRHPSHYIFYALNTMNGLTYGHMGVILYNKKLILQAKDQPFDLDYTMSQPHTTIPLLSCYGEFNSSPYQTWRTAFRECVKLPYYGRSNPTIDNDHRIHVWTTEAQGEFSEWCLRGANDGLEYYRNHADDHASLKNTFDWNWLRGYFLSRYPEQTA